MDRSLRGLEQHFHLPAIRTVDNFRAFEWLARGWRDVLAHPLASLSYGLAFTAAGWLILSYAADRPYLFTAAVSGFFLLAPVLAAGLYEISRRNARGEPVSLAASLDGWRRNGQSMFHVGILLAVVAIGWERISAILFALFYQGNVPDLSRFLQEVVLSGDYVHFLVAWTVVGGALAAIVFALCAVAIPMLADREVDFATAAGTSLKAVGHNIGAMAIWAVLIVALVGIGFATWLLGLIVIMPLLGHATWHAYQDVVDRP
jgi:uncharacterized membrane protein